jgi:non-lysosomal glucosylceramidase
VERTKAGLGKIYTTNRFTDTGEGYMASFRDFLGTGDTGWQMFVHTGDVPANSIKYYNEVMSGFEYAAAASMLQYGMLDEGYGMVKAISERYDGRFRADGEVHMAHMSTVFGTGSPIGEDECGDFYARPLSSWSLLLALQGFIFDGPEQTIGFKPVWQPEDHASFFSASEGWGLFTQTRNNAAQSSVIEMKYGTLQLKKIDLKTAGQISESSVTVSLDGKQKSIASIDQTGNSISIHLESACEVPAGSILKVYVK